MGQTTYGDFIRAQRELRGLSQQQVADKISVSRSTYLSVERGTKELSLSEAEALSRLFGITVDELLQNRVPNENKYKEMILAYLRAAKTDKKPLKKTKLAKLLYFADFAWFYKNLESMSGMNYRRIDFGPVPNEYFTALEELAREGKVTISCKKHEDGYGMYQIEETRASEISSLTLLDSKELKLINDIWKKWSDAKTEEIVAFTHNQLPYKLSFDKEVIPYELITQESPRHVF